MENVKKSVLASISVRFDGMKSIAAFAPSAEALEMLASDPLGGIANLAAEKAAYESLNSVNPLEAVTLQAVLGAVTLFKTEEEAFAILNKAKACWRSAKGLRGLFLSTLNEAELGEYNGDLSRSELIKVCKAWTTKGEQTANAFVLAHSLQDTAKNVLSQNTAQVVRIAKWEEAEETKEEAKIETPTPAPTPTPTPAKSSPLLTSAQIANAKRKAEKAGK